WPGNVRELQNVIERACALTDGPVIRTRDLPDHVRGRGASAPAGPGKDLPLAKAREAWLQAFAQGYLTDLLRRHGGNISQAAKTAGVDRKTLHRLLAKHGIKACPGGARFRPTPAGPGPLGSRRKIACPISSAASRSRRCTNRRVVRA